MKKTLIILIILYSSLNASSQLSWLQLPNYPGAGQAGFASFSINGKGYMGLGFDSLIHGNTDFYEFDPSSNTWTPKTSLPASGRWTCVSFAIGNKGYVITGAKNPGGALTNETWEYDALLDTWNSKAPFPGLARQGAAGFSIGSKGYIGTGYLGSGSAVDFYEFDPANNSWTIMAPFPGPARNGSAGFNIGSKGYIAIGNGTNSTSYFDELYEYDPSINSWSQKSNFTLPYVNNPTTYSGSTCAFLLGGYFYQNSGITHNPMNMLYKYDSTTDSWSLEGTFPGYPRGYAGGFSLSNDIYIGGGNQQNNQYGLLHNDFWKLSNGLTLNVTNPNPNSENDFMIYPNPLTNHFSIGNDLKGKQISKIRIYDVVGKLIRTDFIQDNNESIDVSKLSTGIYFVELVTTKGEVLDSRFIKE